MGVCHGKGRVVFTNGDLYEGDFCENKMHGKGVFFGFDDYHYTGEWANNKQAG
jgi:hypothetical protein